MDFVTEKDKSLQIVCKFRQKRADKRLCDTSKQTFSYLKAKISRGVFNHSRGCSFCNIKSAALPPTDIYIYKPFTSKAAESVRLSMSPRQRRESFQLLPQARLAFGADETRTLIARHRLFSVIFSLFVLAGVSPPASQKEKIPRKFLCGGCVQFSRCGFLS